MKRIKSESKIKEYRTYDCKYVGKSMKQKGEMKGRSFFVDKIICKRVNFTDIID